VRRVLGFDDAETFDAFLLAADACGLGDTIRRLRHGYEGLTPRGGRRWIVHYPATVAWRDCTLARRPGRPGIDLDDDGKDKKVVTLIELPTFSILAPSNGTTHPSGHPYVQVSGSFATIATYSTEERDACLALARSFDQLPRRDAEPARTRRCVDGTRPGDDYTGAPPG
jgi:putative DNA primase/helicase